MEGRTHTSLGGGRQAGTRVVFDHTGFPPELRDHLAAGWEDHYWKALRTIK